MNISEFFLSINDESDFKIVEHELEKLDHEGEVKLKVRCQNGKEFEIIGYDTTFDYYSSYLDDMHNWIEDRINQCLAPQIKDVLEKELEKNSLSSDDIFRKEKDDDITFTFTKTLEDGSYGTTTYCVIAFEKDQNIGGVSGYLIPDVYYANGSYGLMDGISNGCLRIWEKIYGKKKEIITPKLRKYVEWSDAFLVIDDLKVDKEHRGKGLGTKIMQRFLKEYCTDMLTLLIAVNDEDHDAFEEKLYSFYERLGFKKLSVKSQIMYHV
jgi:GNAT superfamily N-acetyltransferase